MSRNVAFKDSQTINAKQSTRAVKHTAVSTGRHASSLCTAGRPEDRGQFAGLSATYSGLLHTEWSAEWRGARVTVPMGLTRPTCTKRKGERAPPTSHHHPPLPKIMFPDELLKRVLKKTSEDHMRQCANYPSISGIFHSVLFYISFTCRRPIITKVTAPVLHSSASGNVFASLFWKNKIKKWDPI